MNLQTKGYISDIGLSAVYGAPAFVFYNIGEDITVVEIFVCVFLCDEPHVSIHDKPSENMLYVNCCHTDLQ